MYFYASVETPMPVPHLPILRYGAVYHSLDTTPLRDPRDGSVIAEMSVANAGLIRRDLREAARARAVLEQISTQRMLDICAAAAELFLLGELSLAGNLRQTPGQYVEALSRTSGLPHELCRRNMAKVHTVLADMATILRGLTRGLDLDVLDAGHGQQAGVPVSFHALTDVLGVVLPSNSPGVNSIWLPAVALRIPVVLKPGREEPWTPLRLIAALRQAGCPPEALSFYPTDHSGADEIMTGSSRAIIFGDDRTLARYANNPAVNRHGTGRSKVLIGADLADDWENLLDLLVASVAENGGRSCINCSTILIPRHADALADALARRLAALEPRAMDDPQAVLSAFANPQVAAWIDQNLTEKLTTPGAVEVTAAHRDGPRLVRRDGWTYLLPTVLRCATLDHPLANTEYLFPFVSVVELPQEEMLERIGPSLVVSGMTEDPRFIRALLASPDIERLNLGRTPTCRVQWDQPHEGNLFEFLYRRRAIQYA